MAWFKKVRKPIEPQANKESRVPEGLWVKCPSCGEVIYNKDLAATLNVCPKCAHHFRIGAIERLRVLFDGDFVEYDRELRSTDPLRFVDTKPYRARVDATIKSTGMNDAVVCATGWIDGIETSVAAMEYTFIGGSMGVVVGEKITRAIERALARRLPVVIVCCSGGARMMEGALSLMQMAKISGASPDRARLPASGADRSDNRRRMASFAVLGDHRGAEGAYRLRRPRHRADDPPVCPRDLRSEFCSARHARDMSSTGASRKRRSRACCAAAGPCLEPQAAFAERDRPRPSPGPDEFLVQPRGWHEIRPASMTRLCEALDHPGARALSVRAAGTNGKGSVTAMVDTALGAAGWRSARYTSPHLSRLEERFVVAGREVPPDQLEAAAARIREAVERLLAAGALDGWPTCFECTTAVAFDRFREARAGVAVLEAGLGGRLDATNVVSPIATAIVSIDFDHQAQLGHTLASIAFEKAGIIKPGVPVVVGALPPEAMDVIARVPRNGTRRSSGAGDDAGSAARVAAMPIACPASTSAPTPRMRAAARNDRRRLGVSGIRVGGAARQRGVTAAWPGRLETIVWQGRRTLLDAAHNPAGARALASYLAAEAPAGVTLVFGAMKDKAIAGMLRELAPVVRRLVCTTAPSPRAAAAGDLAGMAAAAGLAAEAVDEPMAALASARAGTDPIVVAGSIFLVGAVRERLLP